MSLFHPMCLQGKAPEPEEVMVLYERGLYASHKSPRRNVLERQYNGGGKPEDDGEAEVRHAP